MKPIDDLLTAIKTFKNPEKPFVTLSYAQSLDGSITLKQGQPTAISNPKSNQLTHNIRSNHQAILVGIGSALADDPKLTTRFDYSTQPRPILLDSQLRIPLSANIFAHPLKPWVFCSDTANSQKINALKNLGVKVFFVSLTDNFLSLPEVLKVLKSEGINSVMVEGGAKIINQFISTKSADYLILTISPQFLGGYKSLNLPVAYFEADQFTPNAPSIQSPQIMLLQNDVILWGKFNA